MPVDERPVVAAPLAIEAWVLRRGLDVGRERAAPLRLRRTGMGPRRAAAAAERLRGDAARGVAVAGVCGALTARIRPGEVFLAREVRSERGAARSPAAPMLATALRRAGLTVHCGSLWSAEHVVHGAERRGLAASGAGAVDMESAVFAESLPARPFVAVRAVVDTPDRPLLDPRTVGGGFAALGALRTVAGALRLWARALGPRTAFVGDVAGDSASRERAGKVDLMLVVEAEDSADSRRVVEAARDVGTPVYRVDGAESISLAWLAGVDTIGLVAGVSAPGGLMNELVDALRGLGRLEVSGWRDAPGTTHCTLPEEVRP